MRETFGLRDMLSVTPVGARFHFVTSPRPLTRALTTLSAHLEYDGSETLHTPVRIRHVSKLANRITGL